MDSKYKKIKKHRPHISQSDYDSNHEYNISENYIDRDRE